MMGAGAHALLALLALSFLAAGEDTCPAGSTSPECRGSTGSTVSAPTKTVPPPQQADLLTQEVEELEGIIRLSENRIKLLRELQKTVQSGHSLPVPDSHARVLREKMPLLSDITSEVDKLPAAAAEDYLVSKAIIPQEEPVRFIKFLPLRSPRTSTSTASSTQTTLPSALLVAAQVDGTVRLFSPTGELVLTFSAGHEQPVVHLSVSPNHDEYFVATGDAGGVIRVHKVSVRQRRLSKDQKQARRISSDEKVSQHLGSTMNVTAAFQRQMQVPAGSDGEPPQMTALAMASHHSNKYFVAGDAEGKISVFTKNGTLRGKIDTTSVPGTGIEALEGQLSNLLFQTGTEWGYVDLDKLEVRYIECPKFEGRVASAVIDSQQSSRVIAADENGTVWVFNVKNRKECKVDLRFARGATQGPIALASVRGYGLGLEGFGTGEPVSLVALNMSQAGKVRSGDAVPAAPVSSIVWRFNRPPVLSWAVHKRYQQGDLLAFISEDGHEIEIMELLMSVYTAPSSGMDSFGNFKLPVIAIAIVLVLGYQWFKQKSKFGSSGGGGLGALGGKKGLDFGGLPSKRKGGLSALGGLKGKKF